MQQTAFSIANSKEVWPAQKLSEINSEKKESSPETATAVLSSTRPKQECHGAATPGIFFSGGHTGVRTEHTLSKGTCTSVVVRPHMSFLMAAAQNRCAPFNRQAHCCQSTYHDHKTKAPHKHTSNASDRKPTRHKTDFLQAPLSLSPPQTHMTSSLLMLDTATASGSGRKLAIVIHLYPLIPNQQRHQTMHPGILDFSQGDVRQRKHIYSRCFHPPSRRSSS